MAKAAIKPTPEEERIDPATGEIMTDAPGQEVQTNLSGRAPEIQERDMDLLEKYAGQGYSQEAEDGLTPVLSILQDNSGEVKKNHERRMDGAESGQFIIRSLRRLYDGQRGFLVQPFGWLHTYVEWSGEPGEGMPVGRFMHEDPPDDMYETADPQNPGKKVNRRKSTGNRLVDTREHYVNIIDGIDRPFPIVVPMSGSNHSVSRLWTNMMRNMVYKGQQLPAFFRLYTMRTIFRKKGANQTWYGYQVDPSSFVKDRDLLELGASCFDSLKIKPIEGNLADIREIDDEASAAAAPPVTPSTVI